MGLMDKIWDEVFPGSHPSKPSTANPKLEIHDSLPGSPQAPVGLPSGNPAPHPASDGPERRKSEDMSLRPTASQKININSQGSSRRPSLDTSRSLPSGFSYLPDILSPGSRLKEENVWRSVFNPGTPNRKMENLGGSKFDKADSKGPSVYDWYNPL